MRRIIVSEFLSLDGSMEDPGGAEKSKYGGWVPKFFNEEVMKYKRDELFSCDAMLLGRVTYQAFADAWPSRTDNDGFADRMNGMPKFVVSTTLKKAEWKNSTIISSNIKDEVLKLKQQPGQDILIAGSGKLVNSMMQLSLIDEYRFMFFPVVLGGGRRLIREETDMKTMRLTGTKQFSTGIVVLTYSSI